MRSLYEIAHANHTTVGELTGSRRRYSTVHLPESVAQVFGLDKEEAVIRIEHHDEGISVNEIPYISALWDIKNSERDKK